MKIMKYCHFEAAWIDHDIIVSEENWTKMNIMWYYLHVESKKIMQMNV